jgi:hypothetical protein
MRQREVNVALYDTRHKMAAAFFAGKNVTAKIWFFGKFLNEFFRRVDQNRGDSHSGNQRHESGEQRAQME